MKKLEVHLYTNTKCNLFCLHCYNNSGKNDNSIIHYSPSEIDILDTIRYICDNYDAEIHLEGGEIFLRQDLLRKMDLLSDAYLKAITITTNGTIFTDDPTIVHMLKRLAALRVSVESADPQQHEFIRGFSLEKTLKNAERYQKIGIPVWIRVTLNKLNYHCFMNQHIIKLAERGFNKFQVYEFQNVGRGRNNQEILAVDSSLNELIDELCNTSLNGMILKLMFAKGRVSEILSSQERLEEHGYSVQLIPLEEGISIHANGEVFRCAWDNDPANILCNWYSQNDSKEIVRSTTLHHICSHCSAIRILSSTL